MKGDNKTVKTCLRDNEKVKGYFLMVFLALRIRLFILKVLKDQGLLRKMSVNEIIFDLSKMERVIEKSGIKHSVAVPKKVERIVEQFKDMIPMGQIMEVQVRHNAATRLEMTRHRKCVNYIFILFLPNHGSWIYSRCRRSSKTSLINC